MKKKACLMEYVVIAVIIAAAIVVAVWFFGRDVMSMFGVAGSATTGNSSEAESACECRASDNGAAATRQSKAFTECEKASAADENSEWRGRAQPRDSMVKPVPIPDDGGPTPSEAFK